MNRSFQYKGTLKDASLLPAMVEEVVDVCDVLKWEYTTFEKVYAGNVFSSEEDKRNYGIEVHTGETSSVYLAFDGVGHLINAQLKTLIDTHNEEGTKVVTVQINLDDKDGQPEISEGLNSEDMTSEIYRTLSVYYYGKQEEEYMRIREFVRYLGNKYMMDFEMVEDEIDPSRFNEVLSENSERIRMIINSFQELIKDKSFEGPQGFLEFLHRLGKHLRDNKSED